jgi:hypothetical protein
VGELPLVNGEELQGAHVGQKRAVKPQLRGSPRALLHPPGVVISAGMGDAPRSLQRGEESTRKPAAGLTLSATGQYRGGTRRVQLVRGRDETCPVSTEGGGAPWVGVCTCATRVEGQAAGGRAAGEMAGLQRTVQSGSGTCACPSSICQSSPSSSFSIPTAGGCINSRKPCFSVVL